MHSHAVTGIGNLMYMLRLLISDRWNDPYLLSNGAKGS
jgi:hypothetical protein